MQKYETGTKNEMLWRMAEHAIQYRNDLIVAHMGQDEDDPERIAIEAECEAQIRDYRKFQATLEH